jgi:hypothetical protein
MAACGDYAIFFFPSIPGLCVFNVLVDKLFVNLR